MLNQSILIPIPRPLQEGEFYCHKCGKFITWEQSEAHRKEHTLKARLAS